MKKIVALLLLSLTPLATPAVDDGQVMYVGGTAVALKEGVSGKLDATSPKVLSFDYSGGKLIIPFEMIDSFGYSRQVARHLGVLPAIAVGLVDRKSTRLNSSHQIISYAVFCLKKKKYYMTIRRYQPTCGCG